MKRIATAAVLIPATIWIVLGAPHIIFLVLVAVVGLFAYYEFDNIVAASGVRPASLPGMGSGLVLLLAPDPQVIVVIVAMLAMALSLRAPNLRAALPAAAAFTLGVIYVFGAWRCGIALHAINPHWLMFALLLNWAGDTAALYVGKAFGKHKLAPRVSPAKTWEGTAGAIVGALLAGAAYAHFLIPQASLALVLSAAALGNIAGQVGDLCESALKRGAGLKDSGTLLPGHGGWLDRIDSALFGVPAVYALVTIWSGALSGFRSGLETLQP